MSNSLLGDWPITKATEAAQPVADVLPATMKHQPNALGEYRSHRRHVEIVDSYGSRDDHHALEQAANAWLMAKTAYRLGEDGIEVVPTGDLRIPNPDEYNFHDKHTRHDRQDPYTVHVGTSSDIGEAVSLPLAGNATRMAKQAWKTDSPVNYGRVVHGCRTDGELSHGDHKRDVVESEWAATSGHPLHGYHTLIKLATGYRGKLAIGHDGWIKPTGKSGRPSTLKGREEIAAAQLANVMTVTREEIPQAVTGRLHLGAQNIRIQTTDGYVITVRKQSQSSISIDVIRAEKRVKGEKRAKVRTTCSHESYVTSAIDRMLAKLNPEVIYDSASSAYPTEDAWRAAHGMAKIG